MIASHANPVGQRVVIILEGGRVINGTITQVQVDVESIDITRGPELPQPGVDYPEGYEFFPGDPYRVMAPGRRQTTLTVDAEL